MKRPLAALVVVVAIIAAACSPGVSPPMSPTPVPSAAPTSSPVPSVSPTASASPAASSSPAADAELAIADAPRAAATAADAAAAADAVNDFGFDLYRRVATGAENVVVSPASIVLALAMARPGARGATAAEMDAVLRDVATDEHAAWLNALDAALAERSGTYTDATGEPLDVTLRIANASFAQRGLAIEQSYLEALASRFGAGLRLVDYIGATEDARREINAWVDDRTEGRIPELLGPSFLTPDSRLTLVNAIYLKAPWQTPFVASATADGAFHRADGSTVTVPMMALGESLAYAAGNGWQAVRLPYVGGALTMTVLVPDNLAAFEASLTAASLDEMIAALEVRRVQLALPRFGIETKASLADVLGALGMPTAFDADAADFSGITTQERLHIAQVVHQANIDVDEKGTEAAAATAVGMAAGAMPTEPVELRVDRPFLFALQDEPTGAVLFLGRVADPSIGR